MDWDLGSYERIAGQLQPASEAVLAAAAPAPGERLLDIGCGTGNAALAAAALGALATGVDPAPGLLEIASAAANERGLEASFREGCAEQLPLEDASVDVAVSVFGVTFASDPRAAAHELARVVSGEGTIVLSAWLPVGALYEVASIRRHALSGEGGTSVAPFAWHDAAVLTDAFGPFGFGVDQREAELAFIADSPRAFLDAELRDHPLWVAAREQVSAEQYRGATQLALELLSVANEDADGFCVRSRYTVARLNRGGGEDAE